MPFLLSGPSFSDRCAEAAASSAAVLHDFKISASKQSLRWLVFLWTYLPHLWLGMGFNALNDGFRQMLVFTAAAWGHYQFRKMHKASCGHLPFRNVWKCWRLANRSPLSKSRLCWFGPQMSLQREQRQKAPTLVANAQLRHCSKASGIWCTVVTWWLTNMSWSLPRGRKKGSEIS